VVTDLNMGGMSGVDLSQKIKEEKLDTKVILLTSHTDLQLAENAFQLGLHWYLTKPLDDLNDLVDKVREAIGPP
ncbi:MAG TPA: response regulator, partial [Candidatus Manganitrophaceae bacterium]